MVQRNGPGGQLRKKTGKRLHQFIGRLVNNLGLNAHAPESIGSYELPGRWTGDPAGQISRSVIDHGDADVSWPGHFAGGSDSREGFLLGASVSAHPAGRRRNRGIASGARTGPFPSRGSCGFRALRCAVQRWDRHRQISTPDDQAVRGALSGRAEGGRRMPRVRPPEGLPPRHRCTGSTRPHLPTSSASTATATKAVAERPDSPGPGGCRCPATAYPTNRSRRRPASAVRPPDVRVGPPRQR